MYHASGVLRIGWSSAMSQTFGGDVFEALVAQHQRRAVLGIIVRVVRDRRADGNQSVMVIEAMLSDAPVVS
jgi:hypothetical protein